MRFSRSLVLWKNALAPASFLLFALVFGGCGSGAKNPDPWEAANRAQRDSLHLVASPERIEVPLLRSPGLERAWGAPEIKRDASGSTYLLIYKDPKQPFTRLLIYGMTKPLPLLTSPPLISGEKMVNDQLTGFQRPQSWREVMIDGRKVRWFQESTSSGADGAYYSTECFQQKAADGRIGYYRLNAEAGDDTETVVRWFSSVRFAE